jgi:pyruvate dehydrogenase E2 component (dihydrolipoamide acetyltransferase)
VAEVPFHLADVGEGLTEAEIVEWKVAVGEHVQEHQPVVEVETDKARVELPAPATGTLSWIVGEPGELVAVGAVLFKVAVEDGATPDAPLPEAPAPRAAARRVLASPATRRLARELGVELEQVEGSGPGGRITAEDVRRGADGPPPPAPSEGAEPLRGLRRALARSMTAAWTIPHITEFRDVDASELVRLQRVLRERAEIDGIRFGFAPLFVMVAVAALRDHPALNATYDPDAEAVTRHSSVNVGVATDTPDGLIVPVIHDAGASSVLELARRIDSLGEAARQRTLTTEQLARGTFTVTNTGAYGGQFGTPMVNAPEVAIAGFGRTRESIVAVDGKPVVRPMLPLSVSVDHRVVTGAELGAFVTSLERYIGEPSLLLLGST